MLKKIEICDKLPTTWDELPEWAERYGWTYPEKFYIQNHDKDHWLVGITTNEAGLDTDAGWVYTNLNPKQIAMLIYILEMEND